MLSHAPQGHRCSSRRRSPPGRTLRLPTLRATCRDNRAKSNCPVSLCGPSGERKPGHCVSALWDPPTSLGKVQAREGSRSPPSAPGNPLEAGSRPPWASRPLASPTSSSRALAAAPPENTPQHVNGSRSPSLTGTFHARKVGQPTCPAAEGRTPRMGQHWTVTQPRKGRRLARAPRARADDVGLEKPGGEGRLSCRSTYAKRPEQAGRRQSAGGRGRGGATADGTGGSSRGGGGAAPHGQRGSVTFCAPHRRGTAPTQLRRDVAGAPTCSGR